MRELTQAQLIRWMQRSAEVFEEEQSYLTELDTPIGDADHGINLARGFRAVAEAVSAEPEGSIGATLKLIGMTLLRTVGGASGPLYGTLFMRAAAVTMEQTTLDRAAIMKATEAGVLGLVSRGKAQPGDKTMCDTWWAVLEGAKQDKPIEELVTIAKQAAEATIPLQARKGRASYLAERSIGHQDPGATSSYLLVKTLAETIKGNEA